MSTPTVISFPFRGFSSRVDGKWDDFEGTARIAPVGPDYDRSRESWVILSTVAYGRMYRRLLPEDHEAALAAWLRKNERACQEIEAALNSKTSLRAA